MRGWFRSHKLHCHLPFCLRASPPFPFTTRSQIILYHYCNAFFRYVYRFLSFLFRQTHTQDLPPPSLSLSLSQTPYLSGCVSTIHLLSSRRSLRQIGSSLPLFLALRIPRLSLSLSLSLWPLKLAPYRVAVKGRSGRQDKASSFLPSFFFFPTTAAHRKRRSPLFEAKHNYHSGPVGSD